MREKDNGEVCPIYHSKQSLITNRQKEMTKCMTGLTKKQLEAIERVKQNPDEFFSYPKEKQFKELCMIALEQNPEAIKYFKI